MALLTMMMQRLPWCSSSSISGRPGKAAASSFSFSTFKLSCGYAMAALSLMLIALVGEELVWEFGKKLALSSPNQKMIMTTPTTMRRSGYGGDENAVAVVAAGAEMMPLGGHKQTTGPADAITMATQTEPGKTSSSSVPGTGLQQQPDVLPSAERSTDNDDKTMMMPTMMQRRSASGGAVEEEEEEEEEEEGRRVLIIPGHAPELCGIPVRQLSSSSSSSSDMMMMILGKSHGTRPGQNRYWVEGEWMTIDALMRRARRASVVVTADDASSHAAAAAAGVVEEEVLCVLVHLRAQMPCRDAAAGCLLEFHVRTQQPEVSTLAALLEGEGLGRLSHVASFRNILDAGAGSGISTVLLAAQYPAATVVAVEPSMANFEMLRLNTRYFPNVIRYNAGLWNKVTKLAVLEPTRSEVKRTWAFQIIEAGTGNVPRQLHDTAITAYVNGMTIPYVLEISGLGWFDLLKIDIEGSEKELFSSTPTYSIKFMEHVQAAVIEVHNNLRKGARKAIRSAFEIKNFKRTKTGDYDLFTRKFWG